MTTTSATLIHRADSPNWLVSYVTFQVDETFAFDEGQFVMIQAERTSPDGAQKSLKRPYSIATTSKMITEEKQIGFVVKKASDDGMSQYLSQLIQTWDEIQIKGPVGHYTDSNAHRTYLFASVGSGLSPNIGLFHHLAYETGEYDQIIQLYGERTSDDLVPEITSLMTEHGRKNIATHIHLSRETWEDIHDRDKSLTIHKGSYIHESLPHIIDMYGTAISCFLCGKPAMVDQAKTILIELWVDSEDITFEKY